MKKIEELSQILANQIAAGEVVERPASVVKELVENAIDAGSTQIDIYLEEAGLKTIQVIDNGDGIDEEDVLNAFKRHATSKIHTRDDLFRIRSLGFRGEALPSIASVSEITLETSTGEGSGSYLRLIGGEVSEQKPNSLRKGTNIKVDHLFFNTPARLKYVKTLQTELANIGDIVNRLAMSHPNIAFRLTHDGNNMLSTMGTGDLKQTIAGIYGVATAKKMLHVEKQDLDFTVTGFISLPEVTRASRNYLSIIINGRYIKNYLLNKAIIEGYGSKLMVGRFPLVVLQIEMDPLLVDVNVHPTKQEVRLSKEKELMTLIRIAIQDTLSKELLIPNVSDTAPFKKRTEPEEKSEQLNFNFTTPKHSEKETPFKSSDLAYDPTRGDFYLKHDTSTPVFDREESVVDPVDLTIQSTEKVEQLESVDEQVTDYPMTKEEMVIPTSNAEFPDLDYFGQMHGTYLFAQSDTGLYIVDQHAAQERIKYEYFRKKIGEVTDDLQELLVPIVLEYSADDVIRIKENKDVLERVGIFLEEFGHNSLIVRSHPTWYPQGEEESTIREMIDIFLETGKADVAQFREATAIMMSCKQSIKANHHLNDSQARALLTELKTCDNPFNCPHGRPVLIHFTNNDMEKLFKRIQDPH
ncbi:MAG: DNA mismatch repair endonuclease MutL [Vagococcus sp.]